MKIRRLLVANISILENECTALLHILACNLSCVYVYDIFWAQLRMLCHGI